VSLWSQMQGYRAQRAASECDEAALDQALERVVAGTNPRIRAVKGYRSRLIPLMAHALDYSMRVAESIPGPLACNRRAWAQDPVVNAIFAGVDQLGRSFSESRELQALFVGNPDLSEAFALLSMQRKEAHTFGSEVAGDVLQRDVPQVTVRFSEHRVDLPSATEQELRAKLQLRAFDVLVCRAAQRISDHEANLRELETRLGKLKIQQNLLEEQSGGAGSETPATEMAAQQAARETLDARVVEAERALESARAQFYSLEDAIEVIAEVFQEPERYVELVQNCAFLDRLNVRTSGETGAQGQEVCVSEIGLCREGGRAVVIARFPQAEIRPEGLGLEEAERFLG